MKIAIGCDHPAFETKEEVRKYLENCGHEVVDCGTYDKTRTHYPIYGRAVGLMVAKKRVDCGIVICGTGAGISMSANKVKGARCALVTDVMTAKLAREKYNCNIISFGARVVGVGAGIQIVETFLNAKFNNKNNDPAIMLDKQIEKLNDDPHLFDEIIKKWENGDYTGGQKQPKIVLPRVKY